MHQRPRGHHPVDENYLDIPQHHRGYHSDDEARKDRRASRLVKSYGNDSRPSSSAVPLPPKPLTRTPSDHGPDRPSPSYAHQIPSPPRQLGRGQRRFSAQEARPVRHTSHSPRRRDALVPNEKDGSNFVVASRRPPDHHSHQTRPDAHPPVPEVKVSAPTRQIQQDHYAVVPDSKTKSLALSQPSTVTSSSGTLGHNSYEYTPLNDFQLRLLEISPQRMSTLKCKLITESVLSPPEYVAVSYAWGDEGDTQELELGGIVVPVAVSLHGALKALRQRNKPVTVWIDGLCVNQQNRDEKAEQIALMAMIYGKAQSVAIWLGPDADRSSSTVSLLKKLSREAKSPHRIRELLKTNERDVSAIVSLFERDYWKRLWVVQEVYVARKATVYCGSTKLPWDIYESASDVLQTHKRDLDLYFPSNSQGRDYSRASKNQYSYAQILAYQGPASFPNHRALDLCQQDLLLEVMRVGRRKFASDAKDKVFGILGLLTPDIRSELRVDYGASVKQVYTNVVDVILHTTSRLDFICESIHFPLHTNTHGLPSWVPDWSHAPDCAALGAMNIGTKFSASGTREADFDFESDDKRRNKIKIRGVRIDTVEARGTAVGTLCTLADYLMAFIHWRALLFGSMSPGADSSSFQDVFCRTLSLGKVPRQWDNARDWVRVCYHVFASLIRERLPHLAIDRELESYSRATVDIPPAERRAFLQDNFGSRMMGRCFYVTKGKRMGLGSGFMTAGDVIVVPFGCSTPIILRPEGCRQEYRYVGDAYLHGYMYGKAIDQLDANERSAESFLLH
ncbi:Heterokaryon incompatibility protein 6, OR allele [Colletotrichum spinosum]|uniref:Heterokaryon incompatibility protein 6, OR allele n=1 Tax=Colletotrichum spinosum TaxID=1347390 RepID=A0A4R8QAG9_9PEZI|nr:Heterokaryon incompatibility protein 6, OR allele [Colletotrichum spinosum]